MTHSERLETLALFAELFENFLDERGIVLQNDEKEEDPNASNIYGYDYAELTDRIEELLVQLGMMKEEDY